MRFFNHEAESECAQARQAQSLTQMLGLGKGGGRER
jgi:hypothetical protein